MATRKPAGAKSTKKKPAAVVEAPVEAPAEVVPEPEAGGFSPEEVAPGVEVRVDPTELRDSTRMVVFYLGDQRYALPIGRVQEIQQIVAYTDAPDDTGVILGMVNLRGMVVPLVDLRTLVGLTLKDYHLETPMVICRLRGGLVALVVDEVEDVAEMPEGCLQKPSKLHALAGKMLGVCRMDQDLVFLLDLDHLIPEAGIEAFDIPVVEP